MTMAVQVPLAMPGQDLVDDQEPVAVGLLRDPGGGRIIDARAIACLYGLTPAAAALLRGLLDGKRIAEHAAAAGLTVTTAKGYLKQLFWKTGTTRQAELVRLVLSDPMILLVSAHQP
jgi:DNA-binding CsgD family transcriptional regulator